VGARAQADVVQDGVTQPAWAPPSPAPLPAALSLARFTMSLADAPTGDEQLLDRAWCDVVPAGAVNASVLSGGAPGTGITAAATVRCLSDK
jgi:hypothetical protein